MVYLEVERRIEKTIAEEMYRPVGNTFYARFENLHMNIKIFGRQPLIEPAVLALRFTFLCSLSVSRTQSFKKKVQTFFTNLKYVTLFI